MDKINLDNYKDLDSAVCYLLNGDMVVGQEVDSDNSLIYIIKAIDGTMRVSFARDEQAIPNLMHGDRYEKEITIPLMGFQVNVADGTV